MARFISNSAIRATVTISCVLLLPCANTLALAQSFPQFAPQAAPQAVQPQLLGPDQLDNLVAPIALYPDPLLSQVLAACTYPLEIVEAQQWLQQNRNLRGQSLIEAAKQQNWDPSVQLLVAFPDVMALFSRDIRWTTALGNAFLGQQADVMNAIQTLRAQASINGQLATTPQQIVTTETQNAQSAIQIQPADPQVIYPPVYDPAYVWGPSVAGAYPTSSYYQGDDRSGYGGGSGYGGRSGFGNGINLAGLFSGLLGWGGWGWVLSWFTHTLSLNGLFFSSIFGSHNFGGGYNSAGGYGAPAVWAHNPAHRLGVPYSNGFLASRYHGADPGARFSSPRMPASSFAPSGFAGSGHFASNGWHFGGGNPSPPASSSAAWRGFQPGNRMAESYNRAGAQAYRPGFASNSGGSPRDYRGYSGGMPQQTASSFRNATPFNRTPEPASHFAAPRMPSQQHLSMPWVSSSRSSPSHFSAPRGSSHFSAPRHSGGGHSGKGSRKH